MNKFHQARYAEKEKRGELESLIDFAHSTGVLRSEFLASAHTIRTKANEVLHKRAVQAKDSKGILDATRMILEHLFA